MTESKYGEPWERDEYGDAVYAQGGRRIAACGGPGPQTINDANARRIVAAVNAVKGISTEALEAGRLAEAIEMLESAMVAEECDGQEPRCPSCAALNLLRALGRLP